MSSINTSADDYVGLESSQRSGFIDIQASPQFQELRRRMRRFIFPMTALFVSWATLYLSLSAYAHAFMATPVIGNITVGLMLGLGQFVSTFAITALYVRFANRTLDPMAASIRDDIEKGNPPRPLS